MPNFTFETLPKILCEQGGISQLGEIAKSLHISHIYLVTDDGLKKAGLFEGAINSLEAAGIQVTVYSKVLADPPEESIETAVDIARSVGIDGVVGFGGGSSLDTAKLVALLARTPQKLVDIFGINLAYGQRFPLIQVPTTAGTGSEATPISIITTRTHEKKGIISPLFYSDIAILDSHLTIGLPPAITAMTGVDAMVHAIESFTSRLKKNPLSDALAIKALKLLYDNLPTAITNGEGSKDSMVRENMLLGSLFAGMAFANSPVAAIHALAYPLGSHYGLPHGLTNSLLFVPVLKFNMSVAQSHYAELGRVILPKLSLADDKTAATAFVDAITELVKSMPYAQNLRDAKIKKEDLSMLATSAMDVQRLLINNPRHVSYEDALSLYQAAY